MNVYILPLYKEATVLHPCISRLYRRVCILPLFNTFSLNIKTTLKDHRFFLHRKKVYQDLGIA